MFTDKYAERYRNCVDPFGKHGKKNATGKTVITLDQAKNIALFYPEESKCIPGRKLCKRCGAQMKECCGSNTLENIYIYE